MNGLPFISSFSENSIGAIFIENTGYVSAAYPTANEGIMVPFTMPYAATAKLMYCSNGAAVSGNVDLGIYDKNGIRLVSIGETAQSGTSAIQTFDIADTLLVPDWYYMAIVIDNTTGTFIRNNSGAVDWKKFGVRRIAADACPLPAVATMVAPTLGYMPEFGVVFQPLI